MFMCWKCGNLFDEPAVVNDDPSPDGISLPLGAYISRYCPRCGSDDIEQAKECPVCGEHHLERGALCHECAELIADGLERLRDSMDMKQDDFEQAIIDHFRW